MKHIGISILHYNNADATNACLLSLRSLIIKDITLSIFIIDNGSTSPFSLPKDAPGNWKLIRNEKNLGFTGGQNLGIREAIATGADYILVLNNDTQVSKDFLYPLLKRFEGSESVGIVGSKIYYTPGSEYHKQRYTKNELGRVIWYAGGSIDWANVSGKHRGVDEVDKGQFNTPEKVSFITGCCMLLKKEVLEKIGIFDEKYFLYFEDADLCERVKKAGFSLWYEPQSVIWHRNAEASGGSGSSLQEYYVSRNRMIFGFTYGSMRLKIALFRESIRLMKNGRKWQKIGIRDYYLGKYGKGSYE